MEKNKPDLIDLDAVAEAERFGALAISRHAKNRGARMTASGLTTAQLRVVGDSASYLVRTLKRIKRPLRIGRTRLTLRGQGKKEFVAIQSL